MVTVEDLSSEDSLPAPMVVEVRDIEWTPTKSRRAEVSLVDTAGNHLKLIDYEGANLTVDWKRNHRYRITACGVNKGRQGYELAPSKKTRVESLERNNDTTELIVFGDTHIGREKHPGSGERINPIEPFTTVVEYGFDRGVEAFVHTGDIFHDSATKEHTKETQQNVFLPLQIEKVPFHYVEGNHGSEVSNNFLEEDTGDVVNKLDLSGARIAPDIQLYGMDHCENGDVDWEKVRFPETMDENVSILVLHQTLNTLTNSSDQGIDIDQFQCRASKKFDLVVSGHHHDAFYDDENEPSVMYTGAAERMSTNNDPVDRVAWLVQIEDGLVECDQFEIP